MYETEELMPTNGRLCLIGLGLGLFNSTVHYDCVRDKGTDANQWLIVSDWLRFRVI